MVDTSNNPTHLWIWRICAIALLSPFVGWLAGVAEGPGDLLWGAVLVLWIAAVGTWMGRAVTSTTMKRWIVGVISAALAGTVAFLASLLYILSHCQCLS